MTSASPLQTLREMILSGELAPGERLTESGLADRLGLSRTPIRNALPALAVEGFLEPVGKRGYAVKEFSEEESLRALELRAALEGIAAKNLARYFTNNRLAINKGAKPAVMAELEQCLALGDELFKKHYVTFEDEDRYGEINARFHNIIVQNCGSPILISFVERLNNIPFIDPSVVVFNKIGLERAFDLLFRAHGHHHAITEAIREGDGARAEALFREHGNAQRESMFHLASLAGDSEHHLKNSAEDFDS